MQTNAGAATVSFCTARSEMTQDAMCSSRWKPACVGVQASTPDEHAEKLNGVKQEAARRKELHRLDDVR